MSARGMFDRAIGSVGCPVSLEGEVPVTFVASIQPLGRGEEVADNLGWGEVSRWRLYTTADAVTESIRAGQWIRCGEKRYCVRQCRTVLFRGLPLYVQAELVEGDDV